MVIPLELGRETPGIEKEESVIIPSRTILFGDDEADVLLEAVRYGQEHNIFVRPMGWKVPLLNQTGEREKDEEEVYSQDSLNPKRLRAEMQAFSPDYVFMDNNLRGRYSGLDLLRVVSTNLTDETGRPLYQKADKLRLVLFSNMRRLLDDMRSSPDNYRELSSVPNDVRKRFYIADKPQRGASVGEEMIHTMAAIDHGTRREGLVSLYDILHQ